MQIADLPSAFCVTNGVKLRTEAYRALQKANIQHDLSGGTSAVGTELRDFFIGMAKLCPKPTKKED